VGTCFFCLSPPLTLLISFLLSFCLTFGRSLTWVRLLVVFLVVLGTMNLLYRNAELLEFASVKNWSQGIVRLTAEDVLRLDIQHTSLMPTSVSRYHRHRLPELKAPFLVEALTLATGRYSFGDVFCEFMPLLLRLSLHRRSVAHQSLVVVLATPPPSAAGDSGLINRERDEKLGDRERLLNAQPQTPIGNLLAQRHGTH
jgi:hypothetical protein